MNQHHILYSFRRCPYAMRARMALLISKTGCELREVVLKDKPAELIELSPKATVPVLLTSDGQIVAQSLDIMSWALSANDPENWLESAGDPLITTNDGPFKLHLDRYKYAHRHASDPVEHRSAAVEMLSDLDNRLQKSANLARKTRSLADIAIMPFVRQFANTDRVFFDALPMPRLQQWLTTHIASPLFETAMIPCPQWSAGVQPAWLGDAPPDNAPPDNAAPG